MFDLQHFIVIKFLLSLEQPGLNIILMFLGFTNLFFAFATNHQRAYNIYQLFLTYMKILSFSSAKKTPAFSKPSSFVTQWPFAHTRCQSSALTCPCLAISCADLATRCPSPVMRCQSFARRRTFSVNGCEPSVTECPSSATECRSSDRRKVPSGTATIRLGLHITIS